LKIFASPLGLRLKTSYLNDEHEEPGIIIPFFMHRIIASSGEKRPNEQYSHAGILLKLKSFFIFNSSFFTDDKILT